jgi:2'-hydroxyisoflavone reductase
MKNRREFVKLAAASGAALTLGRVSDVTGARIEREPPGRAAAPLKILILGGTGFTGPYQVNYAVARGHQVTVFNRGQRQADIPASVEQLRGDRNAPNGVAALKGNRTWDVVIDVPTTLPKWVRDAGEALKGRAGQYIFISTISTYASFPATGTDENTEVMRYERAGDAFSIPPDSAGRYYGPLKVLSEREAERWFPGKTTIVRPGLIVGPGDPSDRFTYWPVRIARGGEVMVPGDPKEPVQIIDARDIAEWIIRLAENKTIGTFNATGPKSPLTMGEMMGGIRAIMPGSQDIKFTWVPADFLASQQVRPWSHMPVWMSDPGWAKVSIAKAVAAGLTFRSLADTAKATLEWHATRPAAAQQTMRAGLPADREAAVLAAWKARSATSQER